MKLSTRLFAVAVCSAGLAAGLTASARQPAPRPLGALVVPAGFKFEVFAENVGNAAILISDDTGNRLIRVSYGR